MSAQPKWAVVQCEAQREHAARLLLIRLGLETYLPRTKIRNRIVPLFKSYLFVHVVDRWYPILSTPHVVRMLMAGAQPARLKDEIITELRKREVKGLVKLPQPSRLKHGQRVRVVRGSFDGQVGLYDGMSGRDRERVLLELLGRQVRIDLPSQSLAPLDVEPTLAPKHNLR